MSTTIEPRLILETALLTADEPLTVSELRNLFDRDIAVPLINSHLEAIQQNWQGKGIELVKVATGWRFRARQDLMPYLARLNPVRPPRYSRAVMETLAIIAYKQPVTRGDIESIRGVTVSSNVMQTLLERGWVEVIGHKEVPGRPGLYATTKQWLDDLGLQSLAQLPPLTELGALVAPELSDAGASEEE